MGLLLLCALKDDVALDRFVAKKKGWYQTKVIVYCEFHDLEGTSG